MIHCREHVTSQQATVLGGALLLIDADGHGGAVSGEQLAASGEHQQQVDGEQGLNRSVVRSHPSNPSFDRADAVAWGGSSRPMD